VLSKRYIDDGLAELKLNSVQKIAKAEVEAKIISGIYSFEDVKCAVCGSENAEILSEKDRYGLKCITKICTDCGFVYSSPRMTAKSFAEFYDSEYRRLYVGTEKPGDAFFKDQRFRGEKIYNYLKSRGLIKGSNLKVLEIGCGAGGILEYFKSQGHDVCGMDLGEEYLMYGVENHNLSLKKGGIADVDANNKADIIIYSHVVEHLLDLPAELEMIKKHLSNSGIVYIEVPGLRYIHSTYEMNFLKYVQNAHTYHFTKSSLINIFNIHGLYALDADEQVRSVFSMAETDAGKNSLKNEYTEVMEYLRKTEKFRGLRFLRFQKLRWFLKLFLLRFFKH
jgi:2-polyprenyl-3-methyl-5-hydroxy-6-metoxy-1,4-benzoquinol methylase